jgi:hypothetical protein
MAKFGITIFSYKRYKCIQTTKQRLTMRAPDVWESARFQAFCVASNWFRQKSVFSARPAAGNASR